MKYILISIIIFLSFACSKQKAVSFVDKANVSCQPMNAKFLMGLPIQIVTLDSEIVINDFSTSPMLTVYDLNGDSIISQFFRKGRGPNEDLPPLQLHVYRDSVQILARGSSTLYSMPLSTLRSSDPTSEMEKVFSFPSEVSSMLPINDSTYLCSGAFNDSRFALSNKSGEIIDYLGEYPAFMSGEETFSAQGKSMFHQTLFARNRNTGIVAAITSHILELYRYEDAGIVRTKQILLAPYKYICRDDNMISATASSETTRGVMSYSCTDRYIYLLYNPNCQQLPKSMMSEIWIFDWDGNPIKSLQPDRNLDIISVNKDDTTMFVIDSESELLKIDLSLLL